MIEKHCNITAIVLAAGKGSRMHSDTPKQFMMLGGYPVLYYALKAFQDSEVNDIILVTGDEYVDFCRESIVDAYDLSKVKAIVIGGADTILSDLALWQRKGQNMSLYTMELDHVLPRRL